VTIRAKVFSCSDTRHELDRALNAWLEQAGDVTIEHSVAMPGMVHGPALVVFYRPRRSRIKASAPAQKLCGQCKKKPPLPGKKHCEECAEYQRKYRETQRDRRKVRYP